VMSADAAADSFVAQGPLDRVRRSVGSIARLTTVRAFCVWSPTNLERG
jgi:hypothetical protein